MRDFPTYFRLMATILDFQQTQTSENNLTSLSVLPGFENMGIAVGISLLSRTQVSIEVFYMYFRFMAAILNFGINSC
jgi:hypothetical protein